jgi:spore coat polysaccharide biosynthesis protein SpsF
MVTTDALERVARLADAEEREHVTLGIYRRPEEFRLVSVTQVEDRSSLRWTVDHPSDLNFVRAVYAELAPLSPLFRSSDVYDLLDRRPDLRYFEGDQS